MKLLTFVGVSVEGATFHRERPLLLLAYLCLEGLQPRRRLASLFWPDAANPMNSLAQNLIRLRPLTGAVLEHGSRVEALIHGDTQAFRDHCRAAHPADVLTLYTSAFLEGLTLDLEEWLLDTREALAAHMSLAGNHHAHAEYTPIPPTPDHTLIGRHDELSTLIRLPTGSVGWISGPPGIGKTTLLRALTRHDWRLLSARSQDDRVRYQTILGLPRAPP